MPIMSYFNDINYIVIFLLGINVPGGYFVYSNIPLTEYYNPKCETLNRSQHKIVIKYQIKIQAFKKSYLQA